MTFLKAKDEQFSLDESGQILFQEKHGSPLPGDVVGVLQKGSHILKPEVKVLKGEEVERERLQAWLDQHVQSVLEPLMVLHPLSDAGASSLSLKGEGGEERGSEQGEGDTMQTEIESKQPLEGPAKEIALSVYDSLGIVPREDVQSLIDKLDTEGRSALRARRIRLGPILVFIPALNKPAAVKLRAKLWTLFHEKSFPVQVPADGVVSTVVDRSAIDPGFYRSIGYPVYGPRAIRIDMLDRVIVAVYDSAEKGKFKAQHQMAEWLGTSIEDLYAILEAMGHKKIYDPALQEVLENPPDAAKEDADTLEKSEPVEKPEEKKPEQSKPELATFLLKRGRAYEKADDQKKKSFKPKSESKQKASGKKKNRNPKGKEYKQSMMSAGPKPKAEDSPFAVLEQLKNKS